jgi:hypothetical protein
VSDYEADRWFAARENTLESPTELANEPEPFPTRSAEKTVELGYDDWRARLTRNLARRTDGRWDPLTHVEAR